MSNRKRPGNSLPAKVRTLKQGESIIIPCKNIVYTMRTIAGFYTKKQIDFKVKQQEVICFETKNESIYKAVKVTRL